jgi:hypothetical protein
MLAGHTSGEAVSLRDCSKTYIGYMMGVSVCFALPQTKWADGNQFKGFYDPRAPSHLACIAILSSAPTAEDESCHTADMAVAVSPNKDCGILDRAPLRTEPPLPWANMYQSSVDAVAPVVRFPSHPLNCTRVWQLPHDEWVRCGEYMFQDQERRKTLAQARICTCVTSTCKTIVVTRC